MLCMFLSVFARMGLNQMILCSETHVQLKLALSGTAGFSYNKAKKAKYILIFSSYKN